MSRLFGTDGIRAKAGTFPLDPDTVFRIGQAVARLERTKVLIGRDTRSSGIWIENHLQKGLLSEGGAVTRVGVVTTPAVAFLLRNGRYDAGIMVSASHNPALDNGIKIFSSQGLKLSDEEEDQIEACLREAGPSDALPLSGLCDATVDLHGFDREEVTKYIQFLAATVPAGILGSFKVVLDCANGSAFHIAPEVFRRAGAKVIEMNTLPDGGNINEHCGALFPAAMGRKVVEAGADFGVAFDGDSDRAILADERGEIVDGDDILFVLGRRLLREGRLKGKAIVGTVMSNFGLEKALGELGLGLIRTPVGDRFVLERMLREDLWLGGEQSGHMIVREYSTAGDGILTALLVAETLARAEVPLSELRKGLVRYPQVILNVPVREKKDFSEFPEIQRQIKAAVRALANRGRVVVRYSGTEPLARIMIEGDDEDYIRTQAQAIADRFHQHLG